MEILADHISDRFVAELVWERLGYICKETEEQKWLAGPETPTVWRENFPEAPEVISQRKASVQLTRSIPNEYKQALKEYLSFEGYRIGELFPRRTRRATVVNWLLAWFFLKGEKLPEIGRLPALLDPPRDPLKGHPGDPLIE